MLMKKLEKLNKEDLMEIIAEMEGSLSSKQRQKLEELIGQCGDKLQKKDEMMC